VRVDTTQTPLLPYVITQERNAQMGVSVRADESSRNNYAGVRDSDAVMVGAEAVIRLATSIYRDNNHTYDIGFHLAPASIGNYVWFEYRSGWSSGCSRDRCARCCGEARATSTEPWWQPQPPMQRAATTASTDWIRQTIRSNSPRQLGI
jgi:hypothetical protein